MTRPPAYLLAGGRGTRLRPLTFDTPKPLLPFLGASIVSGWLRRLADDGFHEVHLLVGPRTEAFAPASAEGRASVSASPSIPRCNHSTPVALSVEPTAPATSLASS